MKGKSLAGWMIGGLSFLFVWFAFSSIWPLAGVDLGHPKDIHVVRAREVLDEQGINHKGYIAFVSLAVRTDVLDTLQESFSQEKAAKLAEQPNGLVRYYVRFKKKGTPETISVVLHPDGGLIGFTRREIQDLEKGGYSESEFRQLADQLLVRHFRVQLDDLEAVKYENELIDGVRHFRIDAQRHFETDPSLKEIFAVTTGGREITALGRRVELTKAAKLEQKKQRGPAEALSQLGYLLMGVAVVIAYILFLFQLRREKLELIPALKVGVVMFLMVLISALLDSNARYTSWDPVWPMATMWTRLLTVQFMSALWALLLGWGLLAAGNRAPGGGAEKMASFWDYVRLRWNRADVGKASLRGVAIGFTGGAVVILLVKFFEHWCGGTVGLQPRAFYLSMLDRQLPALAILLFFFPIAVVEEAGYRLFAGLWIYKATGSKIIAIVFPAIVFGMIHTSLGFLPPEQPWWGRAVLMTVIGLIWGWAFFRFDFLTVVLCHFMADVVIFCWPLLFSDFVPSRIMAWVAVSLPLWPALILGCNRTNRWRKAVGV